MRRLTRFLGTGAVAVTIAAGAAAPAVAQGPTYPPTGPTGTSVQGTNSQVPSTPSSGQLPFTGAEIAGYTATGAALVLAGGVLTTLVRRRRRRA
jgi:hypothetical protein